MTTTTPPRSGAATSADTSPPRRRDRWYRWDVRLSPYLYIAPYFVIFGVFGLYPLLYTAWVSLQERALNDPEGAHWVGLDNYTRLLFHDPYFWNAMGNTISLWLLTTIPQILLALWIAQLLNRRLRSRTLFRMGVLLPNVTSVAAVTLIFAQLFGRDFGLINLALDAFGLGKIDWVAGTASSQVALAVMVVWRWTGYHALVFLAAMQAIPGSVYEAATIDGASARQQFWHITIPMMRSAIVFATIISTTGNMRLLAEPLLFAGGVASGGSDRQFQTGALYLYETAFRQFDFGYGSAIAMLLLIAILLVTGVNYLVTRRIRTD
ncbi:carbohydrate ABC transporter permease [Goodfellowiella coeruleoviolacea]|uniref:Cellobiose ABC transporter membrane protein n=1 Tax=Goodfellowiella coeruleoviolacea TaxID=334858 RepID=A0AAE3GBF5_9PSEU|nr:sugar ABC transporter permease [Goodfellowiella coeruleoviolacea]MCP2164172.1 cellobiose ABC transporter membrane protein [Goodfellowiella coeruleoviolacea]